MICTRLVVLNNYNHTPLERYLETRKRIEGNNESES